MLVAWHNVEVFAVPIARRMFLYKFVPPCCTGTIEYAVVYPMPKPWFYVYYARWTKEVSYVQQRTYDKTAMWQFILPSVPVLLGAARWDTYAVEFCDLRLMQDGDM